MYAKLAKTTIFTSFLSLLSIAGCDGSGPEGPVGKIGEKGDKGEKGEPGRLSAAAVCSQANEYLYGINPDGTPMCRVDQTATLEGVGIADLNGLTGSVNLSSKDGTVTIVGDSQAGSIDLSAKEADPTFRDHPASTITAGRIEQWNEMVTWGDHRQAGYLSSAVLEQLPASKIQQSDVENWNKTHERIEAIQDFQLHNVITVAPTGSEFTTVADALAAITDASAENRYLIRIAPGRYPGFEMKEYVDIEGAGKDLTVIENVRFGDQTTTIVGASNTELRRLTVENKQATFDAVGILVPEESLFTLRGTKVEVSLPARSCKGIAVNRQARATLRDVELVHHQCRNVTSVSVASGDPGAHTLHAQNVTIEVNRQIDNHKNNNGKFTGIFFSGDRAGSLHSVRISMNIATTPDEAKFFGAVGIDISLSRGSLSLTDVDVTLSGLKGTGILSHASFSESKSIQLDSVRISVDSDGTGISLDRSSELRNVSIRAPEGVAISVSGGEHVLHHIDASASVALRLTNSFQAGPIPVKIQHSILHSQSNAIEVGGNDRVMIGSSSIAGGIVANGNSRVTCVHSYDENFDNLVCP